MKPQPRGVLWSVPAVLTLAFLAPGCNSGSRADGNGLVGEPPPDRPPGVPSAPILFQRIGEDIDLYTKFLKENGKPVPAPDGQGRTAVDVKTIKPMYISVAAPPKEALKHFLRVENSGCLGEH